MVTAHRRGGRRGATEPARSTGPRRLQPCFSARRQRLRYIASRAPDRFSGIQVGERSEEHTSELQSLMRTSYAVFCLKKKTIILYSTDQIRIHEIQLSTNTNIIILIY